MIEFQAYAQDVRVATIWKMDIALSKLTMISALAKILVPVIDVWQGTTGLSYPVVLIPAIAQT